MSPLARRRYCWVADTATGCVLLGALGLAALLLLRPAEWRAPALDSRPVTTAAAPARTARGDLAVIWQRDLRQPLVDPPPKPADPPPALTVRLVGTAVEDGRQYGLFQFAAGTVLKHVGEQIDGCEILAIKRGWAQLRRGAQQYELTVPGYERIRAAEAGHAP